MAHKKKNVRKKECPVCVREFSWSKKLDKNWDSMVYCSDQCRRIKKYEGLEHQKWEWNNHGTQKSKLTWEDLPRMPATLYLA